MAHQRRDFSKHWWMLLAVALAMVISMSFAACKSNPPQGDSVAVPLATPYPGERWGDIIFCDEPPICHPTPSEVTPAPIPLEPGEGDLLFSNHPGYREFRTVEEMGDFIAGRAVFRVPQYLPDNAELLGGYVVQKADGRIFDVGLSYSLGNTNATILNPDLWITYDLYSERPATMAKSEVDPYTSRVLLTTVRGEKAIFQRASDPKSRASLNWFEDDGSAWAVQARGLDLATLTAVAESLTDYEDGQG